MASELSRLIDNELEKFERRPSAEADQPKRFSFGVKVRKKAWAPISLVFSRMLRLEYGVQEDVGNTSVIL